MYGDIGNMPKTSKDFLNSCFSVNNLKELFEEVSAQELKNYESLLDFKEDYPDVINKDNINDILNSIANRTSSNQSNENQSVSQEDIPASQKETNWFGTKNKK